MMTIKRSILAATISAGLSMGIAAPAAANVYGLSSLSVTDLVIGFADSGTGAPVSPSITSFTFEATNTATLNGGPLAGASALCTQATCPAGPPVLDPAPANAAGGTVLRANAIPDASIGDTMPLLGPGADQYSTADSVIRFAQLTSGTGFSETHQIAESELQTGLTASSRAAITSTTGFTLTVVIAALTDLFLTFQADPDQFALIGAGEKLGSSATSNMSTEFSLRQNTGGAGAASWSPRGTGANDCITNLVCVELGDTQDLNVNPSTTVPGTSEGNSYGPAIPGYTFFGINVLGLTPGTWTLALSATTSVQLQRVPEPGVLALLGIGLAGIGVASRRRKLAV